MTGHRYLIIAIVVLVTVAIVWRVDAIRKVVTGS